MEKDREQLIKDLANFVMFQEDIIANSNDVRKVEDAKSKIDELVETICEKDFQLMFDIDAYIYEQKEPINE